MYFTFQFYTEHITGIISAIILMGTSIAFAFLIYSGWTITKGRYSRNGKFSSYQGNSFLDLVFNSVSFCEIQGFQLRSSESPLAMSIKYNPYLWVHYKESLKVKFIFWKLIYFNRMIIEELTCDIMRLSVIPAWCQIFFF